MVNLGRTNLNISNRYNYLGWCVPFNYVVKRRVKKRYLSKNKCKDPGGENKHTHTHTKSTANIWWSQGNGEKKTQNEIGEITSEHLEVEERCAS